MSPLATLLLALSLSTDAFAAALAKGAARRVAPGPLAALRVGATFGAIEALAPLLGWTLGLGFANALAAVDHWVAFLLLAAVGGRMLAVALAGPAALAAPGRAPLAAAGAGGTVLVAAAGTSVDAGAVGISLALVDADILSVALAVGAVTALLATAGVLLGRAAGPLLGRAAGVTGGLVLIALGAKILVEHTLLG